MSPRGIPRSPDQRIDQLKRYGAVTFCMLLLMGAFYIYALNWQEPPEEEQDLGSFLFGDGDADSALRTGPDWLYTEEARLGAYRALQDAGQAQLRDGGASQVKWRGNVHHIEGQDFVFMGFVEVLGMAGGNGRLAYRATVRANSLESFNVVSFSAAPADEAVQQLGEQLPL